ncbi:unnamed protein product [Paramecium sonneborni]|uniref:Uncharacterized protein n=1 Tax=Paramecium sonneborni TaxID=65129 RepID=A0A8S1NV86_9CILI|nr:unnamed protein product [Paramecium sonneborni]
MKIGRWDIMFCDRFKNFQKIGGGQYDSNGNQKKIGKWIELDKHFNNNHQATHNGEYNLKGQKVGIWIEMIGDRKMKERRYHN